MSSVGLELRFTGTARTDAASEPRKRFAFPPQARIQIFELSKLDLDLALAAFGTHRKDIQNERRAIDDLSAVQRRGKVERLRRGELPVEEDGDVEPRQHLTDLLRFPFADIRRRIDFSDFLIDGARIVGIGALDQCDRFFLQHAIIIAFDWLYIINPFFYFVNLLSFLFPLRWNSLTLVFL